MPWELIRDKKLIKKWRKRLCHLSWFMKELAEPIARRSNHEDETTGRFWQGRFSSLRIEDEGALLACAIYVDLNPIRAHLVDTPEDSMFTSVYDRLEAWKYSKSGIRGPAMDAWLASVEIDPHMTDDQASRPNS